MAKKERKEVTLAQAVFHDLSTPLNIIEGYCELLKKKHGKKFDSESRDYFERISRSIDRMKVLLNKLLK